MRPIIDPSTGTTITTVDDSDPDAVDAAVARATDAFATWRHTTVRERRDLLRRIAALVRRDQERLAVLESANAGKPLTAARGEIGAAAEVFEFYAGAVDKVHGETIPGNADGTLLTFREPLGVCAAITPWNFPLLILCWKLAPALAMGNTLIAKPAELTPLTTLALVELVHEAGVPPGVFHALPGPGAIVGDRLVRAGGVRKVSFTGSTTVGTHVMQAAAEHVTNVSLELGGKSASVVFADVATGPGGVEAVVESNLWSVFDNAGQDCCARSRIFVEAAIVDEFTEAFVAAADQIVVGPTTDPDTQLGPLISAAQRDRVEGFLASADADGARRRTGGTRPDLPGTYLRPTVYDRATPDMAFVREEIFGPVVAIVPFTGEAEAIAMANDSTYGLSGSIWCRDIGRALRVARAVETGMLSINTSSSVHVEAPFGGVKGSGIGREQGMVALDHYSERKTVFIAND